jgi:hypothetical protein
VADSHRIHLVNSSQSKPKRTDSADITSRMLAIAKECSETLSALQDYHEMMVAQMSTQLAQSGNCRFACCRLEGETVMSGEPIHRLVGLYRRPIRHVKASTESHWQARLAATS